MNSPQLTSIDQRGFLNTTGSRAVGLLRLLAIAATSDHSRHGPPSLQEIDAIRGLANDTSLDLGTAIEGITDERERRAS